MSSSSRRDLVGRVVRTQALRRIYVAFTGYSVSEHGTWLAMTFYALVEGGPAAVGLVAVLQLVPGMLLTPFSAYAGDRFRPRRALAVGYAVQSAAMLLTALAMVADRPYLAYAAGAVASTAISFTRPVMGTLLPVLTHDPADLVAATVVAGVVEQVGLFVGPLLCGVLLATGEPSSMFFVAAGLTAIGVLSVASLRDVPDERPTMPTGRDAVRQVVGGFVALRRVRLLQVLVLFVVAGGLIRGVGDVVAVIFADERLEGGGGAAGVLAVLYGIGGLVAAAGIAGFSSGRRLAVSFAVAGGIGAAGLLWLSLADGYASALPGFALIGAGDALLMILATVTIQRVAPTEVLARVFGIAEGMQLGCIAIGSFAVSAVTAEVSLGVAFVVTAAAVGVVLAIGVTGLGRWGAEVPAVDPGVVRRLLADPIVAPLPAPVVERLARRALDVVVPNGDDVITQGDAGDRYFLIVDGRVEVFVDGRHVRVMDDGDSFGEIALLHDVPRTATARAVGDVRLLAIGRDAFLEAVTGHPRSAVIASEVADRRRAT